MGIYRGTGGTGDSTTDTTVTTVTEKAAEAASSATSAANSATSAANSASSASASETNAATSETNAANSATASATSATASETAKTAAQAAQTAAETAQANAETAEANAVTAKNQAVSAKDNAVTAQTAAETAETNAETAYANTLAIYGSTTDVQNAVNSASASATTATTKAAEAASSATDASNYSSSAGTSATQAASSASQAATSAASANSYATDAQTAQTAAETAQAAAEAAEYNINGLYLGSLADDPTLDGNGVAVTTGDLYFNTTAQEVRVYTDGDVWEPVVDLAGDITVNSLTSNNNVVVKGNLEVQGTTITVDSATAQTIDLGDNDKIRLGDSDDLQIYHSGTHSYISDQGTGNLIIEGAHFLIQTPNAEKILQGLNNGAVSLYYDGATKLDTTSSGVDITGNITVSGTVDGRDIAADGTTLDAVASTYVDVSGDTMTGDLAFGDNVKAKFGASDDLQIYHGGAHSFIDDAGTGNLYIRGSQINLSKYTGETLASFVSDGAVTLYYDNASKLATTSSGVDITGTVVADGLTVDGNATITESQGAIGTNHLELISADNTARKWGLRFGSGGNGNLSFDRYFGAWYSALEIDRGTGDISFYEDTGTTAKLAWDASAEELQFKDNVKAEFGDGGDLVIYHDGSASWIDDAGTGNLNIRGGGGIFLRSPANETMIEAVGNGKVGLYYDASQKLATTSSGVDITGTVVADNAQFGLGNVNTDFSVELLADSATGYDEIGRIKLIRSYYDPTGVAASIDFHRAGSGSDGTIYFSTNVGTDGDNTQHRLGILDYGAIEFYEDTGTTAKLTWDASAEELQFKDGVAAEFGDGGDLRIYHDGSNSFIRDVGTGSLFIDAQNLGFRGANGDLLAFFIQDGAASLYHNNSKKIETTSTGIDVTGTVTADGLTVAGSTLGQILIIDADGTNQYVYLQSNFGQAVINSQNGTNYGSIALKAYNGTAGLNRLLIANNGDISFYDDAGTSQDFYWDASTSRLGLGVTSPSYQLQLGGSSDSTLAFFRSTTDTAQIVIRDDDTIGYFGARNNFIYISPTSGTGADGLVVRTDTGNVGIGTTSPDTVLHVENGATSYTWTPNGRTAAIIEGNNFSGTTLSIIGKSTGYSGIFFGDEAYEADGQINYDHTTGGMRFATRGSEKARIDSSGNLLVGTTSSLPGFGNTTTGHSLQSGGFVLHSRNGGTVAYMNRNSSDGTIVDLRKDGSTVGSIGTNGSDLYLGTGDTGIRFRDGNNDILPFNTSTNANLDSQVSLGGSAVRFKDLYLSGGVYLGGTGALNLLDDYEEGTFIPTFGGSTTDPSGITYDNQIGSYTKVGTLVQVTIKLGTDAITSIGSGNLRIRGLPFNPNYAVGAGRPTAYSFASNIEDYNIYVANGYFDLLKGSPFGYAQTSVLGTGTNANRLWVTFSYQTT